MLRFSLAIGLLASASTFAQTIFFVISPTPSHFVVIPAILDPGDSDLIPGGWVQGTGCATKQLIAVYPSNKRNATYMDPGCPTG